MEEIRAVAGPIVQRHFEKVEGERMAQAEALAKRRADQDAKKKAEEDAKRKVDEDAKRPEAPPAPDTEMKDADAPDADAQNNGGDVNMEEVE
jgi:heat shock protein 4